MSQSLKTVTLGCKVNQYETQFVREGLVNIGYRDAADDEGADLCIVNTCTVTNEGDSKSRKIIRQLSRKNPDAKIVVMGCYATRAPEEVQQLPGVVEVVTDKRELPDLLGRFGVIDIPTGISGLSNRSRAYIKVQDGCLLRCSYCIIPKVRPEMYSRPVDHILDETQRLVDGGFREIVLTGVHLGHFGVDFNRGKPKSDWTRLSHLVEKIVDVSPQLRVRLSSIEATEVTRELMRVMKDFPKQVCAHLHICMQSGSESVLRRMKRRWGAKRFIDCCNMVREELELPAITTDVIVGFPGETEEEFQETIQSCRESGFSKIHVFPFSARRGTPAADFPNQLSKSEKSERVSRLTEVENELRVQYFDQLVGRELQVLVESKTEEGLCRGTSCRYAPVEFKNDQAKVGELVDVKVVDRTNELLLGHVGNAEE